MKQLIFVFILSLFSHQTLAVESLYFAPSMFPAYVSSEEPSKSSLLGMGIGLSLGVKISGIGLEIGAKRFNVNSKQIASKDFDTRVVNSLFQTNLRLFLNEFNLKVGAAFHHIEMDIYKNDVHFPSEEKDGSSIGLMGGMGINHSMGAKDFYFESTLYPVPEADIYFVDFEVGLRFYL